MLKENIYEVLNRAYFSEDCHEKELLHQLPRLIREATLFVDVGASLGQYTKAASTVMRGGRIVAIEADPVRFEELRRNVKEWGRDSRARIEAIGAAVGSVDGSVTFHTTNSNVSGGLFPHMLAADVEYEQIQVRALTLDGLFPNDPPDFIKADIEGAELRMLLGSSRILRARRTIFLLELHGWNDPEFKDTSAAIVRYMRGVGYWPVSFYAHTLFLPLGWLYLREKGLAGIRKYLGRK